MLVLNIPDALRDHRERLRALEMTARSREIRLPQIIGNDTPGAGRRTTARWFQACLVTQDERQNAGLILRPSRRKRIYNRVEIRSTSVHTHCGAQMRCTRDLDSPWTIDDFSRGVVHRNSDLWDVSFYRVDLETIRAVSLKFIPH